MIDRRLRFSVLLVLVAIIAAPNVVNSQSIMLENYNQTSVPVNKEGTPYPTWSDGTGGEGGVFTGSIDSTDGISGSSFKAVLVNTPGTGNALYAQFNPYNGVGREFTRTYAACGWPAACGDPAQWQFNTYNRLRIWLKQPLAGGANHKTDGTTNANVGLYVKCIALPGCPDPTTDEGPVGHHFYHNLNLPNLGTWIQIILNTHPDHERADPGGYENPNMLHPNGEANYNYWDSLTRFYIQTNQPTTVLPATYYMDEIGFYREPYPENEDQIRNISATYASSSNRVVITWFRNKNEDNVNHEVRYAFSNIHVIGWDAATPAPNGTIVPPGSAGYNGMYYDTTAIPTSGQSTLYLAIKPQNSTLFAQVAIPLATSTQIPAAPSSLTVK